MKKQITLEDCIEMCMRHAQLDTSEKDITIAFALCKMAVSVEPTSYKSYFQI